MTTKVPPSVPHDNAGGSAISARVFLARLFRPADLLPMSRTAALRALLRKAEYVPTHKGGGVA
jgi:hypothetical protein